MLDIRSRDFITLARGGRGTWPLTAQAQQTERMRLIGYLMGLGASDPEEIARGRVRKRLEGAGMGQGT